MATGAELRAEREAAGIRAIALAAMWRVDPATVTRLEDAAAVDPRTARRYRRAIGALVELRRAAVREVRRELLRTLADR